MTQKQIVKDKLDTFGVVDNLWCIRNGIWRLGAIINELRKEGMDIWTEFNNEKVGRNCHYHYKKLTLF